MCVRVSVRACVCENSCIRVPTVCPHTPAATLAVVGDVTLLPLSNGLKNVAATKLLALTEAYKPRPRPLRRRKPQVTAQPRTEYRCCW